MFAQEGQLTNPRDAFVQMGINMVKIRKGIAEKAMSQNEFVNQMNKAQ